MSTLKEADVRQRGEQGFTIVEILIAMALAMGLLASIFLLFNSQSSVYKNQDQRVIASQDAEFIALFLAADLRSAIESPAGSTNANATNVTITDTAINGINVTTSLTFDVWAGTNPEAGTDPQLYRERRRYRLVQSGAGPGTCNAIMPQYTGIDYCLRYDRQILAPAADSTNGARSEILPGITMFRVLRDNPGNAAADAVRALYPDMPPPRPPLSTGGLGEPARQLDEFTLNGALFQVHGSAVGAATDAVPSYTILLEVAVESATLNAQIFDAMGRNVSALESPPRKRIIRYIQVYPRSMVP